MKTIRLYGEMGQRFGREHQFDVATPAEAVRALCSQIQGFRAYLHLHGKDYFKVFTGGRNTSEELNAPASDSEVIRIAPVVQGAGAVGRVIVGIVLMVVGYFTWKPNLIYMGASMVIGGVIEMLSPQPKMGKGGPEEAPGNRPSYNFNGAVNTTAQGHPVPLAYGKIMVGSAVISAGIETL